MAVRIPLKILCLITLAPVLPVFPGAAAQEKLAASPSPPAIRIGNFTFNPAEVTIPQGTAVTWTNEDDIPHTVVAVNKAFRSKAMDTGEQYSFVFAAPGTYEYFCSLHPHMKGKVIVK
jgi:amicyanin